MYVYNPLLYTPLNTKRVFVMATTHSGCEVYMPVDSNNAALEEAKKAALQAYLDSQPVPPTLTEPEPPMMA